jgi:hypothetical protein
VITREAMTGTAGRSIINRIVTDKNHKRVLAFKKMKIKNLASASHVF